MIFVYDIEIFKNFFSVIFSNVDSEFDDWEFIVFEERDDKEKLKEFLSQSNLTLVGFNNIHFDNVILNGIIEGLPIEELWHLSQDIIDDKESEKIKQLKWKKVSYNSIDLMRIYAFDNLRVGLKQVAINLKWPKIQELPIPYDSIIIPSQVPLLLSYNRNDVGITKKLYFEALEEIKMRQEVGQLYGIDLINASDSRIANLILETIYQKETGLDPRYFKELRTQRSEVRIRDCIGKNIEFQSKPLQKLLYKIQNLILKREEEFFLKETIVYANKVFDLRTGGLHSQDKPGIFYSDDKQIIIDADVASFYPNIMLINKIKPAHLDWKFLDIFERITNERIEAKKLGHKTKADALKITINSVFGKLGFEHFWLYDPLAFYSVTISGQLYLLMLIEYLFENKFEVLSANTDGVICRIPINRKNEYYQTCKEWEIKTGFTLEFTTYKAYARRDVNNYIAKKEKGQYKTKGVFELNPSLNKGYRAPIIPHALKEYLLNDKNLDEILSTGSIYDFLISQKASKKFQMYFKQNGSIEPVQHINRWYVSKKGGQLVKRHDDREISLCSGGYVSILNDISDYQENDIDYEYYKQEILKIVQLIKPEVQTLSLF